MNITGYLHHTTANGTVVTVSTCGDLNDAGYSVVWRSGENFTDILCVEHIDRMQKGEHYRSSVNRWGRPA